MTLAQIHNPFIGVAIAYLKRHDTPNIEEITECVCLMSGVPLWQIFERRNRCANVIIARHLSWKIIRETNPSLSLKQIGIIFNGFDHTTVLNGLNVMEDRLKYEPDIKTLYDRVKRKLRVANIDLN